MGLLSGKRSLVFTDATGVGSAMASRLGDEGAVVFHAGPRGDVRFEGRPSEVTGVFDAAEKRLGKLDVVVDARLEWAIGFPEESAEPEIERLLESNFLTSWRVAIEGFRRLEAPGSLCGLTCVWATATSPEVALTGSTRAGLGPLIKALALRGIDRRVRANLVSVGWIDTPELRELAARRAEAMGFDRQDALERSARKTAIGRPGTPDEVAKVVAFLSSDRARFMTGLTVLVDGGLLWA